MITTETLLEAFVQRSADILGEALTGIYLHGSAVMGCLNPRKSDLDLIIVVTHPLTEALKRAYMDMVVDLNASAPAKGIEMSIVTKAVCRPFVYPTPFDLHFSIAHLSWYREHPDDYIRKMQGMDRDLAAHFTILRKRGKCLYGPPIDSVFGEVPPQDYMDSIRQDISGAVGEISENTMYLTLNLARVLAYHQDGLILSKKEGGEWALSHVPVSFHTLVRDALHEYVESEEVRYDPDCARAYAEYMLHALSEKAEKESGTASGNTDSSGGA